MKEFLTPGMEINIWDPVTKNYYKVSVKEVLSTKQILNPDREAGIRTIDPSSYWPFTLEKAEISHNNIKK